MIENASLLRGAAGQIDELDDQIRELNDAKKDIYANVRDTVAPADFKAWRDAVKLRQKRRVDRMEIEEHEARVADMLHMLEATGTVSAIHAGAGASASGGIAEDKSAKRAAS